MNRKITTILLALAVVVALAIVAGPRIFKSSEEGHQTVSIAINAPLTGPISAWGGQFPDGFQLGIEDASQKYGIDPKTFSVDVQDNAGNNAQAVSAFAKQRLKDPEVYVTVATGPVHSISGEVDKMPVLHFVAAFDPFLTKRAANRLRVMANSKIEAPFFIDYAVKKQPRKVYLLQLNLAYAEEQFGEIVEPQLKEKGISVVRERYDFEMRDFKTLAAKVSAEQPDLIFIVGYSFHLQPLLRDLRAAGLVKRGSVVTVMDLVDLVYGDTPIEELRDIFFMAPLFDISGAVAEAPAWRQRFEKRFGRKPNYVPAYAYDNAGLIVKAYAKSGKVDMASIRAALPYEGIDGEVNLDSDRDILLTMALAEVNADRQIVPVRFNE